MSNEWLSPEIREKIANRQAANKEILEIINSIVEFQPDMRFGQLLWALNIVSQEHPDPYYDEPDDILKRIKNSQTYKLTKN